MIHLVVRGHGALGGDARGGGGGGDGGGGGGGDGGGHFLVGVFGKKEGERKRLSRSKVGK